MVDPDARTQINESKPDPFVGKTFDGYRIEELIGRGGMGTVYRATQLSLGRPIALKVLTEDLSLDTQFLQRFHREADVLSKLSHPNIVTVFDRGEVDGRPYLAMEYVEGTSLRDIMRRGPCAPEEALRIVSSVLSALQHAHEKGIVHRDIKPENVLLSRGDVVKVADFGLSRLIDTDETRLTRTHLVLGTYEYMAPEQRERSREADHRSDIYATGVILYEMLTGELPIGRFHLPSEGNRECDSRIDDLIERSLDKDPDRRYQNAKEMAGAVSQILDRPSDPGFDVPDAPKWHADARDTVDKRYRPVRFEYHCDNVATIDHVLGTVFYAIGILSLFTSGFRHILLGLPFFAFFIAGWYLRETSAELRKFKRSARTSQAVISILCGFTGILLPYTIYSLWVLFGHRGRTYYEARARGMGAAKAAAYTRQLLEDPYGQEAAPRDRSDPMPPRPPTPSEIPVQSMVTDDVPPRPPVSRRSVFHAVTRMWPRRVATRIWARHTERKARSRTRLVTAGMWIAGLTIGAGIIAVASGARLRSDDVETPLIIGVSVAGGLLALGVLRVLTNRRRLRGIVPAVVTGFTIAVACAGYDELKSEQNARHRLSYVGSYRLGSFATEPPAFFEATLFRHQPTAAWLQEATNYPGELARSVRLQRRGATLWVQIPFNAGRQGALVSRVVEALREVIRHRRGKDFIASSGVISPSLRRFMDANPIPTPPSR